ncbi:MAG: hypothetical protein LBC60_12775 [Spirochaetaceae bacterium]|jgi:putative exporter of polyketide antibiotics|nr:hypothetical protein [Spirochaetaceae bacterium]
MVNDKNHLKIEIINNEVLEYKDGFEITIYYTRENSGNNDNWMIKGRIHEVKSIRDIGIMSMARKTVNNLFYLFPFYLVGGVVGAAVSHGLYKLIDVLASGLSYLSQTILVTAVAIILISLILSIPKKHDRTYKIPKWDTNYQRK